MTWTSPLTLDSSSSTNRPKLVTALTVIRPAGPGALVLQATGVQGSLTGAPVSAADPEEKLRANRKISGRPVNACSACMWNSELGALTSAPIRNWTRPVTIITAIETIWKRKFATTHWTWEVQDILARAAADGKIHGLATLLETIATTDAVEDVLDALHKLRPPQPKPTTEFTLNYCRGKLDAIKVVWAGRFSRALLDEHLDLLIDAMRKDVTSVDSFLKSLASGMGCEGLRAELDRLRSGK